MERYDLNAVPNASSETAGVLRVANEVDEKNCGCKDAAITPSNLYNLLGYRKANTAYTGNEIVACPYHTEFLLKCVQAGTTSEDALDTTNVTKGQIIEDGGVKWTVIAKAIIDASISGKNITLTFADGTTKTLTTQDTNTTYTAASLGVPSFDLTGRLTQLYNGGTSNGDITLSKAYTNFKALFILHGYDASGQGIATTLVSVYELQLRASKATGGNWLLVDKDLYWRVSSSSTTTKFVHASDNGTIYTIWGVN